MLQKLVVEYIGVLIYLRLCHSNNIDKTFQRQISLNFKIIQSDTV